MLAAFSPAAELPSRTRPVDADPHAQLRQLALARGPLRRALAAVAGRLMTTRAWEPLGFARLRDFAVERTGHSARSLQDLARVDAALAPLPRVEAALVSGELTWTKVRLLCRVANTDDEGLWVAFAREKTARRLSCELRAVDRGALESGAPGTDEDGALEEESETVQIRCAPVVRARWWQARQLARRVAGEALPVWGCMEAIAAEVVSALPLEREMAVAPAPSPTPAGRAAPRGRAESTMPARTADGCAEKEARSDTERGTEIAQVSPANRAPLPPFLASLVRGLESADAFELDERLRRAVALEQRLEAEMGRLLFRIAEGRLHRTAGFASMDEYARERLGISPRKARALLRLERAGRRAPLLREAYRDGRLSWVQAHALLPVLAIAPGHQRPWFDWACAVTVRRLQEDVERALVLHEMDPLRFEETGGLPAALDAAEGSAVAPRAAREATAGAGPEDAQAGPIREGHQPDRDREDHPDRQTGAKPTRTGETCRIFWNGPRDAARFFRAVLCTVRRHLERHTGSLPSEGEALDAMLEHVFEAWTSGLGMEEERVRAAHRVFARDGWRCTVPGCSSYRELHDHHIRFRSAGGSDAERNRITLCAWHHLRGVHAGPARLRLRGRAPRGLRFELGLRPEAPPLLRYSSGDRIVPGPGARPSPRSPSSLGSRGPLPRLDVSGWSNLACLQAGLEPGERV